MNLKKLFAVLFMLISLSFVSFGQVKDDDQNFGNKRNINPNEKDFGKIAIDAKVSHQYVIKAMKDADLTIGEMCIPEGVTVTVNSKTIKANSKEGGFTVAFDAAIFGIGNLEKDLYVKFYYTDKITGDKVTKEVKYTLKAIVEAKK